MIAASIWIASIVSAGGVPAIVSMRETTPSVTQIVFPPVGKPIARTCEVYASFRRLFAVLECVLLPVRDRAHLLLQRWKPVGERKRVVGGRARRPKCVGDGRVDFKYREIDVGAIRDDVRAKAPRRAVLACAYVDR